MLHMQGDMQQHFRGDAGVESEVLRLQRQHASLVFAAVERCPHRYSTVMVPVRPAGVPQLPARAAAAAAHALRHATAHPWSRGRGIRSAAAAAGAAAAVAVAASSSQQQQQQQQQPVASSQQPAASSLQLAAISQL